MKRNLAFLSKLYLVTWGNSHDCKEGPGIGFQDKMNHADFFQETVCEMIGDEKAFWFNLNAGCTLDANYDTLERPDTFLRCCSGERPRPPPVRR